MCSVSQACHKYHMPCAMESVSAHLDISFSQAESAIESEVARRLELCGADFKRWPRAARDEVARLEKKLEAAQGLNGTLHAEVGAAAQQRQTEAVARAQLQVISVFPLYTSSMTPPSLLIFRTSVVSAIQSSMLVQNTFSGYECMGMGDVQ